MEGRKAGGSARPRKGHQRTHALCAQPSRNSVIACPVAARGGCNPSLRPAVQHATCIYTIHDATCNVYIPCNVYHPACGMLRLPVHRVHGPPVPHHVVLCCNASCIMSCCVATRRAVLQRVLLQGGPFISFMVGVFLIMFLSVWRLEYAPAPHPQSAPPRTRQSWRADRAGSGVLRLRRVVPALQPSWRAWQVRARDGLRRAVCGAPVEGVLHLDHHVGADHGDRGFVDRRR